MSLKFADAGQPAPETTLSARVRLTPRPKKLHSYARDGRNPTAEARGITHQAVAKRKAKANRALRRAETVAAAAGLHDVEAEMLVARTGARSWRKHPDAPLAKYVDARLKGRITAGSGQAAKGSGLLSMAKRRARYRPFVAKDPLQDMER
jgi:hypothetical protein